MVRAGPAGEKVVHWILNEASPRGHGGRDPGEKTEKSSAAPCCAGTTLRNGRPCRRRDGPCPVLPSNRSCSTCKAPSATATPPTATSCGGSCAVTIVPPSPRRWGGTARWSCNVCRRALERRPRGGGRLPGDVPAAGAQGRRRAAGPLRRQLALRRGAPRRQRGWPPLAAAPARLPPPLASRPRRNTS